MYAQMNNTRPELIGQPQRLETSDDLMNHIRLIDEVIKELEESDFWDLTFDMAAEIEENTSLHYIDRDGKHHIY